MSPAERRALLLLFTLGVVGQGVRWLATRPGQAPGSVELLAALPPHPVEPHRDSAAALARPLRDGERIDIERAPAAELARLPRIGMALAKTIVADREARGPFASLEGLDRVSGVGPGLLGVIGPHVTFGGQTGGRLVGQGLLAPLPQSLASLSAGPAGRRYGGPSALLDLNSATAAALDSLPGIGPARARAIVEFRTRHGSFSTVDDLGRVPGFGPAALARVRDRVSVR